MAAGFLQRTASYLWNRYGTELQHFCLVFPNKRAPLFFSRYLSQCTDKPIWAPAYSSTEKLVCDITGWHITDRMHALVTLYRTFRDEAGYTKDFSEFWHLGELILNDFDEVDRQMAPAGALFRNVADLNDMQQDYSFLTPNQKKAIDDFWGSFSDQVPGKDIKQHFAGIWPKLYPVYQAFRDRLAGENVGYEGMVQRRAAELLEAGSTVPLPYKCFVFIGFHALTTCEQKLFQALRHNGRALFFWDYDTYFTSDDDMGAFHEAGKFLKDYIRRFPSPDDWSFDYSQLRTPKDWKIVSVPSETGQARMAGTLLEELAATPGRDWSRTAVVLPDEHMLMPMLSCIPPSIGKINITMGCAFTMTPASGLYDRLFQLQSSARENEAGPLFYHQSVKALLQHPYLHLFAPEIFSDVIRKMAKGNIIHLTAGTLLELIAEAAEAHPGTSLLPDDDLRRLAGTVFGLHRDARYVGYLKDVTILLATLMKQCDLADEAARFLYPVTCLYTACTTLQRLGDVLTDDVSMPWDTFARLFKQYSKSLRIPFSGEPLEGLQIMGMLETRTLDFDHVIVLSMNEGIMPPASATVSLIPYSFRGPFGLSGQDHHDALHAYCFYRLMQRAQFIRCLSFTGGQQQGEQSRFLTQIQYDPALDVRNEHVSFNVQTQKVIPICEPRSEEVRTALERFRVHAHQEKGPSLTPSALNTYLQCRLRFWFKYVRQIKEPDEVTEEIDARIFGNIFHRTMQTLYTLPRGGDTDDLPVRGTFGHLTADILQQTGQATGHIREVLDRTIDELFFKPVSHTERDGRSFIVSEVLFKYILKLLQVEQQWGAFTPVLLEGRVALPFAAGPDASKKYRLGGIIDRMDWHGHTWRILDYKTGKTEVNFPSIENLFDRQNTRRNKEALQLLTYAYIVSNLPEWSGHPVVPGLVRLRDLFSKDCDYRLIHNKEIVTDAAPLMQEFGMHLQTLMDEIFSSDQSFDQTECSETCKNCPYKAICQR